jgi:hypothetical protein
MSSSNGSSKLRRKEKEWKPKMKSRGQKPQADASGSALAAQMAMANIKDLNRRRDRGQEVDEVVLAKISQSLERTPTETPGQPRIPRGSQPTAKKPRTTVVAGLIGGGCLLLLGLAFLAFGSSRYSVAGTLLLERKPLAGAELQFHAAGGQFTPSRVTTSADGGFSIRGLPAGVYRVTVQSDAQAGADVPVAYKAVDSTPLRMKVQRNLENVSLYAVHPKRR